MPTKPAGHPSSESHKGVTLGNQLSGRGTDSGHSDSLVHALARYVEALHRRYPDGPEQMRREGLDGRANITGMSDRRKGTAS